jgi:hypothetical protein
MRKPLGLANPPLGPLHGPSRLLIVNRDQTLRNTVGQSSPGGVSLCSAVQFNFAIVHEADFVKPG